MVPTSVFCAWACVLCSLQTFSGDSLSHSRQNTCNGYYSRADTLTIIVYQLIQRTVVSKSTLQGSQYARQCVRSDCRRPDLGDSFNSKLPDPLFACYVVLEGINWIVGAIGVYAAIDGLSQVCWRKHEPSKQIVSNICNSIAQESPLWGLSVCFHYLRTCTFNTYSQIVCGESGYAIGDCYHCECLWHLLRILPLINEIDPFILLNIVDVIDTI